MTEPATVEPAAGSPTVVVINPAASSTPEPLPGTGTAGPETLAVVADLAAAAGAATERSNANAEDVTVLKAKVDDLEKELAALKAAPPVAILPPLEEEEEATEIEVPAPPAPTESVAKAPEQKRGWLEKLIFGPSTQA
jgi:hypothetical protein